MNTDFNNEKRLLANQIMAELYADKDIVQLDMLLKYAQSAIDRLQKEGYKIDEARRDD